MAEKGRCGSKLVDLSDSRMRLSIFNVRLIHPWPSMRGVIDKLGQALKRSPWPCGIAPATVPEKQLAVSNSLLTLHCGTSAIRSLAG